MGLPDASAHLEVEGKIVGYAGASCGAIEAFGERCRDHVEPMGPPTHGHRAPVPLQPSPKRPSRTAVFVPTAADDTVLTEEVLSSPDLHIVEPAPSPDIEPAPRPDIEPANLAQSHRGAGPADTSAAWASWSGDVTGPVVIPAEVEAACSNEGLYKRGAAMVGNVGDIETMHRLDDETPGHGAVRISAEVRSSGSSTAYKVVCVLSDGGIQIDEPTSCTCPHFQARSQGLCKHMVALLLSHGRKVDTRPGSAEEACAARLQPPQQDPLAKCNASTEPTSAQPGKECVNTPANADSPPPAAAQPPGKRTGVRRLPAFLTGKKEAKAVPAEQSKPRRRAKRGKVPNPVTSTGGHDPNPRKPAAALPPSVVAVRPLAQRRRLTEKDLLCVCTRLFLDNGRVPAPNAASGATVDEEAHATIAQSLPVSPSRSSGGRDRLDSRDNPTCCVPGSSPSPDDHNVIDESYQETGELLASEGAAAASRQASAVSQEVLGSLPPATTSKPLAGSKRSTSAAAESDSEDELLAMLMAPQKRRAA